MASSSITSISSILDDLQALENDCLEFPDGQQERPKRALRCLRTFLLCAKNCGNDNVHLPFDNKKNQADNYYASLEVLAVLIGYTFPELAKQIADRRVGYSLELNIDCVGRDICRWYASFLGSFSRQSSDSLSRKDDLIEFIDSLLENQVNYRPRYGWVESIEPLVDDLAFMKNLIRFVALHAVENTKMGPLLAHVEAVAIRAACLFFRWPLEGWPLKGVPGHRSIPIETCIQALIASKLSRQSYGDTHEHILRDFFHSLLQSLWKTLISGTCPVILHQLQMFYEGIDSLRSILKEKPEKFDEKVRDPTRVVDCYGADFVSPLPLNAIKDAIQAKNVDLVCSELLEIIKLINAIIKEKYPESSSLFNFPRANGLGFIDSLLEKMIDLTSSEAGSIALMNHPIQKVQEELDCLRSLLREIVELRNEDEEVQRVWDRIVGVAYRIEDFIDSLIAGNILDSSSLSIHSILEEMDIIKAEASKICNSKRLDGKVKQATKRFTDMPRQGSKPVANDVVVGLKDEATKIINRLTRGSSQMKIVSIVGMAGQGKTTLARKVYNDSLVKSNFHARAWCTVSQQYHIKTLFLEVLSCTESDFSEDVFKMSEEELAHLVQKRLQRNRYLIVLDDVWDIQAWNGLEASFPDNGNGSRVILTSRLHDVAPQDKLDGEPHHLRELTHEESWDLLKKKLYPGKDLPPSELCDLQQQVVEMCQGLPLTVVILAGILSTIDESLWKEVVEGLSSRNFSSTEQCTATLELSYKNLSDNLKECFLYFGAFPEDYEHNTRRLVSLWIAEGFAQKTQHKRSEDVANDYLMELIGKSLVIVSEPRSIDGVKTCRIHDLLHEFCVTKAKEEKFLQLYDDLSAFNVPCYQRRLCIDSKPERFDNLRASQLWDLDFLSSLFLIPGEENVDKLLRKFPNIRKLRAGVSLRRNVEYCIAMDCLNHLESLCLSCSIYIYDRYQLDFQYPLTIKKLTLSHFRLPWSKMAAIGNLPNLEVLKLLREAFEGEIWEMEVGKFPNLRFLKLHFLDIVKWTASEDYNDYFPRLQKLVLESCFTLQEIPYCLGDCSTLETIEVSACYKCTSSLKEIQSDYPDLKIHISD